MNSDGYGDQMLVLPDPVTPFIFDVGCGDRHSHVHRQARLRATVGAATRRIVKQDGTDAFTLRRLANDTGVSSQTLYNNFGPRDQLVVGAFIEYDAVMVDAARKALPSLDGLLLLEEGYGACIRQQCDYTQQVIRFILASDRSALETILRHGQQALRSWMEDLHASGALRDDVDREALGRLMVWINVTGLYEWAALGATASYASEQLLFRMRTALLGAASAEGRRVIDAYVDRPRALSWR